MKHTQIISTLALLAIPIVANAQPDPNNAPKAQNPVNRPVGGGRVRAQVQNLTPEQRATLMRTTLKRQLVQANVTADAQQNAVADYVLAEAEGRQKLEEATRALQTGLRNRTITDAQIAGLLNDYNVAIADDKERHEKALETLKATIDVTQFPRLEAMLTLAGLYGDSHAPTGNLVALLGAGARGNVLRQNRVGADAAPALGGAATARGNIMNRRGNARNNRPAPF